MKAKTLFSAYQQAVTWRDWASDCRDKGDSGVLVDNDAEAIKWRRYDRLARKIWARLQNCFGEMDAGPK